MVDYTKSIDVRCMDCGYVNQPHKTKDLYYMIEARYCEHCGSRRVDVEYCNQVITKN